MTSANHSPEHPAIRAYVPLSRFASQIGGSSPSLVNAPAQNQNNRVNRGFTLQGKALAGDEWKNRFVFRPLCLCSLVVQMRFSE